MARKLGGQMQNLPMDATNMKTMSPRNHDTTDKRNFFQN